MDSDCSDVTPSGRIINFILFVIALFFGIMMYFMAIDFCIWIKLKVFRRTDRSNDANIIAVAA